ncbi:hypothetical protein J437_LFUL002060 [Ladona fulva]|uniref:Uncharacterized protein n=1 Tax=Ladona fulva TaxID=123851 RepID=A0A8K0NZG0_LADFU|nr:hypothetical protein J437_LFUL002060 [Ladona fulva]
MTYHYFGPWPHSLYLRSPASCFAGVVAPAVAAEIAHTEENIMFSNSSHFHYHSPHPHHLLDSMISVGSYPTDIASADRQLGAAALQCWQQLQPQALYPQQLAPWQVGMGTTVVRRGSCEQEEAGGAEACAEVVGVQPGEQQPGAELHGQLQQQLLLLQILSLKALGSGLQQLQLQLMCDGRKLCWGE